ISVTSKTGSLVGILDVTEKEDLMITCKSGVTIRMPVSGVSEQGRATQGVKLIRVDEGDEIAAITRLDESGANGNGAAENGTDAPGEEMLNDSPDTTPGDIDSSGTGNEPAE